MGWQNLKCPECAKLFPRNLSNCTRVASGWKKLTMAGNDKWRQKHRNSFEKRKWFCIFVWWDPQQFQFIEQLDVVCRKVLQFTCTTNRFVSLSRFPSHPPGRPQESSCSELASLIHCRLFSSLFLDFVLQSLCCRCNSKHTYVPSK